MVGLVNVVWVGNVVLFSVIGNGVGDDKFVYMYVLIMIEYYFYEKLLLVNVEIF